MYGKIGVVPSIERFLYSATNRLWVSKRDMQARLRTIRREQFLLLLPMRRGLSLATATIYNMKDIRLGELSDGSILVATRPQGGEAGLGSIGLTRVKRLDELNQKTIENAILINDLVCFDIKVGALGVYFIGLNHDCNKGCAGIIGVMAYSDPENKWHYFVTAFKVYNTYTFESEGIKHSPIEVIAWRKNWQMGLTKRPQTENVVFPAGIIKKDGNTVLVSGLSDAQTGELIMPDPFTS